MFSVALQRGLPGINYIILTAIALMSLLAFGLVWNAANNYQQLTIDNHSATVKDIVKSMSGSITRSLFSRQLAFTSQISQSDYVIQLLAVNDIERITARLEQAVSDASGFQIRSILLRDENANLLAGAYKKNSEPYYGCPVIVDKLEQSVSDDNQHPVGLICTSAGTPLSEIVQRIQVGEALFYIHVVADLVTDFNAMEQNTGLPVQLQNSAGETLWQSTGWVQAQQKTSSSNPVQYVLYGVDNVPGLIITTVYDQTALIESLQSKRFTMLVNAGLIILLAVLLLLLLLRFFLTPLARVQKSLGVVSNDHFVPIKDENLPVDLAEFVSAYNQVIMVLDDATQKHAIAEKNLRSDRDFITKTLNAITNSVVVIDSALNIKLVNPAFEALLQERHENLLGYSFSHIIIMYANQSLSHIADFEKMLAQPRLQYNLFYQSKDSVKELEMTISPVLDMTAEDVGYVLVFRDVTEGRMLRRQLNYESRHDKLTGLLNRQAFEDKFAEIISENSVAEKQHVFIYFNIDNFNLINQSCGNDAGDQLLQQTAKIISQKLRKSDISACLGGDEFAVILAYAQPEKATDLISDILAIICKTGFNWHAMEYSLTASAALIPFGLDDDTFSEVLSRTETAASLAKQNGGNQYYLIDAHDEMVEERHASLTWVARINQAFVDKRFKLYAQPIAAGQVDFKKSFYEILIRYQTEEGEIICARDFLEPAERFKLIDKIDRWVVSEIIHWMATNPDLKKEVQFFINLSARSVCSSSFYDFLHNILKTALVDPTSFCFEITETAIVKDLEKSIQFIKNINALGASFSLDNFGSGVSSLAYLKKLPVEFIKIDGLFIDNLSADENIPAFVKSIVELGHSLDMKIIAEQVETKRVIDELSAENVDYFQGSAIQEPTLIEDIDFTQVYKLPV